jgi:hypothetical protein
MHQRLALAAVAAFALAAGSAVAQPPGTPLPKTPGATPASPPATSAPLPSADPSSTAVTPPPASTRSESPAEAAPSASASGTNASVTTGMDVKDNTGATIGKVSEVKAGSDGKKTATIKMGADVFAVDTASLAVANGAATVNASQSEIKSMLGKAKK